MVRLGIDENGLGPRLGPLVVTAVVATTRARGTARAEARPKGALRERLGRLEEARRVRRHGARRGVGAGHRAAHGARADADARTRWSTALSLDAAEALRAPCPEDHARPVLGREGEAFRAPSRSSWRRWSATSTQLEAAGRARRARGVRRDVHAAPQRGRRARAHALSHGPARDGAARARRAGAGGAGRRRDLRQGRRLRQVLRPRSGRWRAAARRRDGGARAQRVLRSRAWAASRSCATPTTKHLLVCMASLVGKWVRDPAHGAHRALPPRGRRGPARRERLPRSGDDALRRRDAPVARSAASCRTTASSARRSAESPSHNGPRATSARPRGAGSSRRASA